MLNEFGPGQLPGGDVKGGSKDITSYREIEEDAKLIFGTCVLKRGLFGWMQTGMYDMLRSFCLTHSLSLVYCHKFEALESWHSLSSVLCIGGKQETLMQVLINSVRLRQ